jgi:large subunit ribosomal protein L4
MPKRVKGIALRSALSVRARDGQVTVLTDAGVREGRTRELAGLIKALGLADRKCLLVLEGYDAKAVQAGRNLPRLNLTNASEVNTYDVLWADHVLITNAALETLKETRA